MVLLSPNFERSPIAQRPFLRDGVARRSDMATRLSEDRMYERVLASDAAFDGRFFFGVVSTGIYCLPSCRARKPQRRNVRFFPSCEAARAAGLRPCRKCHPDDFARGADPVLETVETLVGELRAAPGRFADVRALVGRSGFGSSRLFELVRRHYHTTPAELLVRARVDTARTLLETTALPLVEVAAEAGFESQSTFHEQFRRRNGMTPSAYRDLAEARSFDVALPPEYPLGHLRRALSRDEQSLTERLDGDTYRTVLHFVSGPRLVRIRLKADHVTVEAPVGTAFQAHAAVVGILGLEQDAAAFARQARRLGFARLVRGREGLRIVQTPTVFDGLLWSIVGQQVAFGFACTLRRRLVERVGRGDFDGLWAPPTPADVAALEVGDLVPLQYSRQKASYLVSISRMIAEGRLDAEGLRHQSATRVERSLLALRGLGPWSVNYVMMRSLGFLDCVPYGDTGVTSGLQTLYNLELRPDVDATRRLMEPFSPMRSLATTHLWQINRPSP